MEEKVLMAALAGLLHDVGKFAQRAGEQVTAEWSDGKNKQDFGYQHALHTWHFVNKYLPSTFKQAGILAAFHHRPNDAGKIIQTADYLSAGERSDDIKDDDNRKSHPRQLLSIFSSVYKDSKPAQLYLPLSVLNLERQALFPQNPLPEDEVWKSYKVMWDGFCSEAAALKTAHEARPDLESYLEAMLAIMQRYTYCIPSAYYKTQPNISLYDHSRMTSALAAILSRSGEPGKGQPAALLIGGDISGVQDFIYTISAKGAAKTLRGRSFYLQLLTEAALRFVLRRLGLPYTNVIYSGGGNFFILAHPQAKEQLPEIRAQLSRILLRHHGPTLYLALGCAEVPAEGFEPGKLRDYWDGMHRAVNLAKQQRYAELGDEAFSSVFSPVKYGGNPDETCSVCGNDKRGDETWDELEGQERICPLCRSFADEIGKEIPKYKFLVFGSNVSKGQTVGKASDVLAELGMTFKFYKAGEKIDLQAQRVTIWGMDDAGGKWPVTNLPAACFTRYTANKTPVVADREEENAINRRLSESDLKNDPAKKEMPKSLTHLQVLNSGGFEYLGVIRLDVDNVGEMFKNGLGDLTTLSRIAALSSQMSLFFEGWLKRICESDSRSERIYTVYSGGDDAFLIGPWELMPGLASEIAAEFADYTGNHPRISLSAGMSFIGGKYPIYQAAKDAYEALEKAKNSGKDAFHFLGGNWKWSTFTQVEAKFERIVEIVENLDGPRAIIQTLRMLAEQKSSKEKTSGKEVWGPWQWRGAYLLLRMEEREKNRPKLVAAIHAIREELDLNNYSELNQWGTAARWAQLITRNKNDER